MADAVQQVRLAQADAGMEVERVVEGALALVAGDALGGGMGQGVGAADHEAREGEAGIERRTGEVAGGVDRAALGVRDMGGHGCRAAGGMEPRQRAGGRAGLGRADGRRAGGGGGAAHADLDPADLLGFRLEGVQDAIDVVRLDPALEEAGRHGEPGGSAADALQFEAREPAREHVLAEFGAQAALDPRPGRADLHGAPAVATVVAAATRNRFVDTHHWLSRRRRRFPGHDAYARFTPSASRMKRRD